MAVTHHDEFEALLTPLDPVSRDVVRRVYHHQQSIEDIAAALEMTAAAVSTAWMRGLRAITARLEALPQASTLAAS